MPSDASSGRSGVGICHVEFFGVPRILTGLRHVEVDLSDGDDLRSVLRVLASRCPALVGPVIRPDVSGLADGLVLNVNGTRFVTDLQARVAPEDSLLLLSSAAGG